METQKLPFEITSQIERYLEDVLFLYRENFLTEKEAHLAYKIFFLIDRYINGEIKTRRQDHNQFTFWEYLEKQGIIKSFNACFDEDIKKLEEETKGMSTFSDSEAELIFAIARIRENPNKSVKIFQCKQKEIRQNLEKISPYKYIFLKLLNIKPIEILLEKIKEKTITDENNKNIEYTKPTSRDFKVRFDSQNGVVRCGDEVLKFQKGLRGERPRLLLFKKLWPERKHIKSGVIKALGRLTPPEMLAVQLDIANDSHTFNQNQQVKDRFFDLIKGINRALKSKNIPAKIERTNGIQLVVIEK